VKHNGFGRCDACGEALTDYEMSLKNLFTDEYVGLCSSCCKAASLSVSGNPTLMDVDELDNYFDFDFPDHKDRYDE
jgi:hypothetical protein